MHYSLTKVYLGLHIAFVPSMVPSPTDLIEKLIFNVRGYKVMFDSDLARIYGVSTKHLNQQVKRNLHRFPKDFMFQLTETEAENLRSQFVTSSSKWGGRRYLPYMFTEHGAVMLAMILNSSIAVAASTQIVRAFINLRQALVSHADLNRKIQELEKKYDSHFKAVFDAIRELMTPTVPARRKIGIISDE